MKKKNKTLYIIPGFGEKCTDAGYCEIIESAKTIGYSVVPININWQRTTIKNWLENFESQLDTNGSDEPLVLGFSFGAMIALISHKRSFKKIIICSLSPYFRENIKKIPTIAKKMLGKKRMENFTAYSISQFKNAKTPTLFITGDKDWDLAIETIKKIYHEWGPSKDIRILNGVGHDISDPLYIEEIRKILKIK